MQRPSNLAAAPPVPAPPILPTRIVAGVAVPDTPLVARAIELARGVTGVRDVKSSLQVTL